jgi:hypothetical protein
LTLAAVLAVIVVIGAAILGTPPVRPRSSSPSASTEASIEASPSSSRVLSLDELQAAVDESALDQAERTVIADASIDRAAMFGRLGPLCGPQDTCAIGLLTGIHGPAGGDQNGIPVQAGPGVRAVVSPSGDPFAGLLALTIHGRDTIELLGVVQPGSSGGLEWAPSAAATTPALGLDPAHVIVVDGWLDASNQYAAYSCPKSSPGPIWLDTPFQGCPAGQAWIGAGPGSLAGEQMPPDAIRLQPRAYIDFAPDPSVASSGVVEPRRASYLLRVVTGPPCGSEPCRGLNVVGRLNAGATPAASLVLDTAGLQNVLGRNRADGSDETVLAQATIDRAALAAMRLAPCPASGKCPIGALAAIEPGPLIVVAAPDVAGALPASMDSVTGVLALHLSGPTTVELVGVVEPGPSGIFAWAPTASATAPASGLDAAHVILVDGWLGAADTRTNLDCLPRAPFQTCDAFQWISAAPVTGHPGGALPLNAIEVEPGSYQQFAPLPSSQGSDAVEPRPGAYLLRVVTVPECSSASCRGWRVVGRVDDGNPLPAASPSSSATDWPDLPVLSQAELSAVIGRRSTPPPSGVVIADATIDGGVSGPFCPDGQPCQFGVIDNGLVSVAWESELWGARGFAGLFAFALNRAMVLGDVHAGPDASTTNVVRRASASGIRAAAADMKIGELIVVNGWLVGTDGMRFPCPPESAPTPPASPFQGRTDCNGFGYITPESYQPITPAGGMLGPQDALEVQQFAYTNFAPVPVISGGLTEPRHALYLIRNVADAPSGCSACGQAWDVVAALSGDLGP